MTSLVEKAAAGAPASRLRIRARQNRLLRELPGEALDEVLAHGYFVPLTRGDCLDRWFESGAVVFPLSGIIGGVLETIDGECIQPVFIGSEGVLGGMRSLHGAPYFLRFKVRLSGEAVVISATVLRRVAAEHPELRMNMARVTYRSYHLASLHAACARFHTLSQRCCAWLSLLHREVEGDIVPITHEELAEVVGATRPAVSAALSQLSRKGVLTSMRRGAIRVLKPQWVASHACACWTSIDLEEDAPPVRKAG